MLDTVFFFSAITLFLVAGIVFSFIRIKNKYEKHGIFFTGINSILFLLCSYLWFFEIAIDGISQVLGVLMFGIAAVLLTVAEILFCHYRTKEH
ncbi:hypothetical protein AM500_14130 [Bacillus sp. FJAT-18017]|uniref:hypothetical protein n=1 Tax=Bacillus sp. FJAT-18017 TaxID=1705566 RepID=UPI0006AEB5FD|nr:hypothetical protein [Bacillus sp. FJAT-18017]ALC90798.1 hypothetical protein AM500_14130 [Bacillus sp. FJAT-18017]